MKESEKITNILIVGVGGQGVIVASTLLAEVVLQAGFDVKKSEVHGMAQRGGSVVSQVRFGPQVFSPLIKRGEGDMLLSFEQLETLRYLDYLSPQASIFINDQKILPPSVSVGIEGYPENISKLLKKRFRNTVLVDGLALAQQAGNPRAINTVLLGVLSQHLDIKERYWIKTIRDQFPPHLHKVNEEGFQLGRKLPLAAALTPFAKKLL